MSLSGNPAFDAAVAVAQAQRQAVLSTVGVTQIAATLADQAYFESVLAASLANAIVPTLFAEALAELGVTVQLPPAAPTALLDTTPPSIPTGLTGRALS
jgi:hypothetical protein